jgi:hypothetical protein
MGKITVKHYLNTKTQPAVINNENHYPVYIQITVNRKTTKYRSITFCKLSEKEFNNYINGNVYKADFYENGVFTKEYFEKEPERIKSAFEFIAKRWGFEAFNKKTFSLVWSWVSELFLMWSDSALTQFLWNYMICSEDKGMFYKSFNMECTLTECIKCLNTIFDIDIKEKIPVEDLELWNNTDLLLKSLGKNSIYIDFVCNYKNEIEKVKGIKNKERFMEIIRHITENFGEFSY